MTKQIAFFIFFAIMMGVFTYTIMRYIKYFGITKKGFKVDNIGQRAMTTLLVAFGQTKILQRPVIGMLHAVVWWGFMVTTIGTGEMVFDGLLGTERILGFMGPLYSGIVASGDIFAALISPAPSSFSAGW